MPAASKHSETYLACLARLGRKLIGDQRPSRTWRSSPRRAETLDRIIATVGGLCRRRGLRDLGWQRETPDPVLLQPNPKTESGPRVEVGVGQVKIVRCLGSILRSRWFHP